MTTPFTVACVQVSATRDIDANIATAAPMVHEARARGADFICLPEMALLMEPVRTQHIAKAEPEADHRGLAALRGLARETGAMILAGSLSVKVAADKLANRSFLIDPAGAVIATYDKIHMFDVDLAGGESYRESKLFSPGERAVLAPTPWGALGMTVCYDMRFAYLYRALAKAGAMMITVPAAFTVPTGRAHWHVLLRTRAIETGCFVIAPAQCGEHAEGRRTYGHSLIIAPWGEILAEAGEAPEIVTATIDLAKVEEARRAVPSLRHDRSFAAPEPIASAQPMRAAGE